MTENKRFRYSYSLEKVYDCDTFNGETTESYGTFECCDLLNELYDENKQLKAENEDMRRLIDNISQQRDEFHRGARENANHVGKLKKENKELKQKVSFYKDFQKDARELGKENLDLSEELDYYKTKCASLETGLFQADKENNQLKMGIDSLKLLVQNWEALDEEKDEQLDRQNQALKKLVKENAQLKQLINDKEVEWLRNNTVWEQMPTNKRTITKTTFSDENERNG